MIQENDMLSQSLLERTTDDSGYWKISKMEALPNNGFHERDKHYWGKDRRRNIFLLDVQDALLDTNPNLPPMSMIRFGSSGYNPKLADDFDTMLILPDKLDSVQINALVNQLSPYLQDSQDRQRLPDILSNLGKDYHTDLFNLRRDKTKLTIVPTTQGALREQMSAGFTTARKRFMRYSSPIAPKPFLVSDITGNKYQVEPILKRDEKIVLTPGAIKINNIPVIPYIFEFLILGNNMGVNTIKPEFFYSLKRIAWRSLTRGILHYNHLYDSNLKPLPEAWNFNPNKLFIRSNQFSEEFKKHIVAMYKKELDNISNQVL